MTRPFPCFCECGPCTDWNLPWFARSCNFNESLWPSNSAYLNGRVFNFGVMTPTTPPPSRFPSTSFFASSSLVLSSSQESIDLPGTIIRRNGWFYHCNSRMTETIEAAYLAFTYTSGQPCRRLPAFAIFTKVEIDVTTAGAMPGRNSSGVIDPLAPTYTYNASDFVTARFFFSGGGHTFVVPPPVPPEENWPGHSAVGAANPTGQPGFNCNTKWDRNHINATSNDAFYNLHQFAFPTTGSPNDISDVLLSNGGILAQIIGAIPHRSADNLVIQNSSIFPPCEGGGPDPEPPVDDPDPGPDPEEPPIGD